MIETYGVDLAPVQQGEEFVDVRGIVIPGYEKILKKHEKVMELLDMADESFGKIVEANNSYQKAKLAFREALHLSEAGEISPVRVLMNNLPDDVRPDQFEKIFKDFSEHIYTGAEVVRPFADVFYRIREKMLEKYKRAEALVTMYKLIVRFWNDLLDMTAIEYVFEHADMKYKTKACRDAYKIAKAVCSGGAVVMRELHECGRTDIPDDAAVTRMRYIITRAENRVEVFGEIKSCIEQKGIEAAFKKWQEAERRTPAVQH